MKLKACPTISQCVVYYIRKSPAKLGNVNTGKENNIETPAFSIILNTTSRVIYYVREKSGRNWQSPAGIGEVRKSQAIGRQYQAIVRKSQAKAGNLRQ
jgi:hypothetical protein